MNLILTREGPESFVPNNLDRKHKSMVHLSLYRAKPWSKKLHNCLQSIQSSDSASFGPKRGVNRILDIIFD